MSAIIDLVLCGIVILVVLKHTLKGFVGSILDSFKLVIAAFLAYLLRYPVALLLNRLFMREWTVSWVRSSLEAAKNGGDTFINFVDLYGVTPSFFNSFLADYGLRETETLASIGTASAEQIDSLALDLGLAVSMFLSTGLAMVVSFVVLLITLSILVKVIDKLIKFSPIKTVNRLLGLLLGLLYSFVLVLLLSYLLELLVFISGGFGGALTANDLDNSVVVSIVRFFI